MPVTTGAALPVAPFRRTVCACGQDQDNCARPGYLIPGDLERIAGDLGSTVKDILYLFRPGKGAVVMDARTRSAFRIPTIVPRTTDTGCVFRDVTGGCRIHAVAPFGCAYFDVHMPRAEADQRSLWGLTRITGSEAYHTQLEALKNGGDSCPTP